MTIRTLFFTLCLVLPRIAMAADSEAVPLGVITELTGSNAANGLDCRRGIEVARSEFAPQDLAGGRNVQIIFADHAGDAKTGVNEFKKLVEFNHIWAAVVTRSQVGMPLNPISAQAHVPLLGTVGHPLFVPANPYAFRFYPSVETEGLPLAEAASRLKARRLSVLSTEDEWTLALAKSFIARYRELGGVLDNQLTIQTDDNEVSSVISKLKAGKPEAVFVNLTIAHSGLIIRKLREQGYHGIILTNFWGAHPDSIAKAGMENMEGVIFTQVNLNRPVFQQRFRSLSGPDTTATSVTYCCYSALSALLQTIAANKGIRGSDDLAAALQQQAAIHLLDEELRITGRDVRYDIIAKVIRQGKIIDFQP